MPTRRKCPKNVLTAPSKKCSQKAFGKREGKKLGCGEQGCAYKMQDAVLKITKFNREITEDQWLNEACIGKELGENGIAPTIYKYFICQGSGYILMERLVDVKHAFPEIVKKQPNGNEVHSINLMPKEVQHGFINVLFGMLQNGYIHMDNHIGNLGFVDGNPIVFDFGFTVRRTFEFSDMNAALAFSIFQILEHCPPAQVLKTHLWKAANQLVTYKGGSSFEDMKTHALKNAYDVANIDIYVGCYCYLKLLRLSLSERYDSPLMDVIYRIRQSKSV